MTWVHNMILARVDLQWLHFMAHYQQQQIMRVLPRAGYYVWNWHYGRCYAPVHLGSLPKYGNTHDRDCNETKGTGQRPYSRCFERSDIVGRHMPMNDLNRVLVKLVRSLNILSLPDVEHTERLFSSLNTAESHRAKCWTFSG